MTVTIRFGGTNETTKNVPESTTVGTLLGDAALKSVLGFGSNVQGVVNGTPVDNSTLLDDGDVLTIETKANSKAVAFVQ